MIIAIVNNSGNVGKSMIANQVLKNRIPNARIIAVETINDDGTDNEKLRGDQFDKILDSIFDYDDAIIDIGSSNIEAFLEKMHKFKGSEHNIDLFIVPTVNEVKVINDTVSIIQQLSLIGISKYKIAVIFNKVEDRDILQDTFCSVFANGDLATINKACCIYKNELFNRLTEINMSIDDIANDDTDYRLLIRKEDDSNKRTILKWKLATHYLALGVKENFDIVFNSLFENIEGEHNE